MKINGKIINKNIKGIIFDVDGTLMDSEPLHIKAYATVAKKYGTTYDEKKHLLNVGVGDEKISKCLKEEIKNKFPSKTWQELVKEKKAEYVKGIPELNVRPGIKELIIRAQQRGLKLAVASSTSTSEVKAMLKQANLLKVFMVVIGGDGIAYKPHPEIYLKALQELRLKPEEAIVIEDSPVGAAAGVNAGMLTIAFPHKYSKHLKFPKEAVFVDDMDEIEL